MRRWCALVLVVVALAACGSSGSSGPTTDAGAYLACTHFRDVSRDYSNGILTPAELRTKLQEVNHDAQAADSPAVRSGSLAMLRDFTQGGVADPALANDVLTFGKACTEAGF